MRKILYISFLLISFFANSQNQVVTQTFVDRCTGETKTVTANFINGSAVVAFYNRVKTFTWSEYTNGTLQSWLDETYLWWTNLSPCSTNTATSQTTQQTTTTATSNATNAAANAAGGAATNTPPTNAASNGNSSTASTPTGTDSSSSSSSSSSASGSTDSNSTSGDGNSQSNDSSGGETSSGGDGETTETNSEGEGGSSENSENQESSEEESSTESESSEDSESEESESDEVEEESSEEESEEESSEEESEEEEKEEKKEEKKKQRNPIAVAANIMTQSGLDGTLTQAASFGFSQSSLTGTTTYSANLMVWDNLQQFSLGLSKSDVYFNYDREEKHYLLNPKTKRKDLYFGTTWGRGSIMMIQSISANFMYIYGTKVASFGLSNVYLGQKENFWKGFVGGFALSGTIINVEDNIMIMPSGVLFGTKPFPTKRVTISPMLALALNPVSYNFSTKGAVFKGELALNEHVTYIVGSNFDVALTQRFRFNIGGNIIGTTLPGIPLTWSATIGSKFQF